MRGDRAAEGYAWAHNHFSHLQPDAKNGKAMRNPLSPPWERVRVRGNGADGRMSRRTTISAISNPMPKSDKRKIVARARELRRNATDAERRLWSALRGNGFANAKFRRQAPIGSYIVDFVSFSQQLVIEVDGGQHGDSLQSAYDHERTLWLESEGFEVLRFWNNDVFDDLDTVLTVISRSFET